MAKADDTNTYFMGFGPHQTGTLRHEVAHSTSRPAKERLQEIPREVALERPRQDKQPQRDKEEEGKVQLTSAEQDE